MTPSLTDTLCTRCGLCCDGSLFADVELASPSEASGLEILGLEIEEDEGRGLLILPCAALKGRRCTIYAHRPACCRTFECGLLQDVRRGVVSEAQALVHIEDAIGQIARVKSLLGKLGPSDTRLPLKERCAEALAIEAPAAPALRRDLARLEVAMGAVERLIRTVFLRGHPF